MDFDDYDARTIGSRVHAKRERLGLSLTAAAQLSGLSKGFFSKVENGKLLLDRRSHIVAVSATLKTTPSELLGVPYPVEHPARSLAYDRVAAVRLAFMRSSLDRPLDIPTRPLPVLAPQVSTVIEQAQACDYDVVGQLLPSLILELHVHAATNKGGEGEAESLRLLAETLHAAFMITKSLGFADLAWAVAERHEQVTKRLGDPVYSALSVFLQAHTMLPAGAIEPALADSDAAAAALEPYLDQSEAAQLYGMHHLTCAFASAVLGKSDDAHARLAEAEKVAQRIGEGEAHHLYFGPTNVGIWRTSIGVELGEGGKVAEYASAVRPAGVRSNARRATLCADVARGLSQERGHEREALAAIQQAEEFAPQWVPTDPLLRQIVQAMVERARAAALDEELSSLAWRMGVR